MSELRWNPLLRTYTMVAAHRQHRPHMPQGWCPFCVGSGRVPDEGYKVLVYPNDYPVLSPQHAATRYDLGSSGVGLPPFYHTTAAVGHCEVLLYSPDHYASLGSLSVEHIYLLVQTWQQRYLHYSTDPSVRFVFIFENRGEEVGVTMPHPHGQLYAYPFVPLKISTELDSCQQYFAQHQRCLLCDMNQAELSDSRRIVAQNEHFVAYIPHFTDYPFGVFVLSKQHLPSLAAMNHATLHSLASMLQTITASFDKLYDRPFPYMMCLHQTPINSAAYADSEQYYHFHIEFYPPLRSADRVKWYASSEMGAWAAANVVAVEQTAPLLRALCQQHQPH